MNIEVDSEALECAEALFNWIQKNDCDRMCLLDDLADMITEYQDALA